jgi:hypothetical protein
MTDYLLAADGFTDGAGQALNVALDVSSLNGIGINLWTIFGTSEVSVASAITYKMRGMDAALNGVYDTWLATAAPDTSGAYYGGVLAQPLRDIVVVDSWTALPGSIASGNPYIDPPAVANAFDDEFNSGSPALELRASGFIVKTSAGVTLTRGGEIQPWNATGPTGNTYWSSLMGSWLMIQPPNNTQIFIHKAITLAAGDTYWARVGGPYRNDPGANGRFSEVAFYASSGGFPDVANRVYASAYESTTAPNLQTDFQRTTAGGFSGSARNGGSVGACDMIGVRFAGGSTYWPFMADSASGRFFTNSPTGAIAGTSMAFFNLTHAVGAGGAAPNILGIDFIRKKTGDAWIASP